MITNNNPKLQKVQVMQNLWCIINIVCDTNSNIILDRSNKLLLLPKRASGDIHNIGVFISIPRSMFGLALY